MSSGSAEALRCFAAAAPGLEPLVAAELAGLGIDAKAEPGGAAWAGDLRSVVDANLWLRTASRVIVRAASFRARAFYELERHAKRVAWERFVVPGQPVTFRVTARKSKLYHTEGIAQRLAEGLEKRLGTAATWQAMPDEAPDEETEPAPATQLFVVRLVRDECVISADASGERLHRRGYRQQITRAPLRETLAAAMLLGAGWRGDTALTDPLCGSGTIAIEAAMMARRMAPGARRRFAFFDWPDNGRQLFDDARNRAEERMLLSSPVPIAASDRDAGAIEAATANAARAGVADDVTFEVRPVSAMRAPGIGGFIVTNPPYGVRVGETGPLRDLYAQLGWVARKSAPGGVLALLSPDPRLDRQLGLPLEERFQTSNGGIPVRLVTSRLAGTSPNEGSALAPAEA